MKKLPYKTFKYIFSKVPRLTVEVIVKNKKGIVLTKRAIAPYKHYWHIPGGSLLLGEKVLEAVDRICKEELGVKVKHKKFLCFIEYHNYPQFKSTSTTGVSLIFLADPVSEKFKSDFQSSEIKQFKNLPAKMLSEHRKLIKDERLLS